VGDTQGFTNHAECLKNLYGSNTGKSFGIVEKKKRSNLCGSVIYLME
jgi:hypothetical protein